jgi:hypothetical protein
MFVHYTKNGTSFTTPQNLSDIDRKDMSETYGDIKSEEVSSSKAPVQKFVEAPPVAAIEAVNPSSNQQEDDKDTKPLRHLFS